jgi:tRNA (guanosine-2'-O-)-methyltransferase
MLAEEKKKLIAYLSEFISDKRKARFDEVIAHRTGHLRIVLEDLYQAHNASAVLRSCDCFGVQYVDFIENRNKFKISPDVAMGSSNWLSITRHNQHEQNTVAALQNLKKQGYRIVATTPHTNDVTLEKLPVDKKLALVFGTEIDGITDAVRQEANEFVRIPMYGFTESFNISVCAALCMYELTTRIRRDVKEYLITEEEKSTIYLDWLKNSIEKSDAIVDLYYKEKGK